MPIHSILILQTAFLGDLILTTGILEKLHRYFPQATLDLVIRKGYRPIFDKHPFVSTVYEFDKSKKLSQIGHLAKTLRSKDYDLVINTHRYLSSGVLSALVKAKIKTGYRSNPFAFLYRYRVAYDIEDGRHEVERLNDLVIPFTDAGVSKPKLYVKDFSMDLPKGKNYICIAPGSVWTTKRWPVKRWVDFIRRVDGCPIYLLGGKADYSHNQQIIEALPNRELVNTAGKIHILASVYLMQNARMNYVMDSAPLHMASAVDAPVTALFLSTIPEFGFYPLSTNRQIVQVKSKLPCRPCGYHGHRHCPKGHFKCAQFDLEKFH